MVCLVRNYCWKVLLLTLVELVVALQALHQPQGASCLILEYVPWPGTSAFHCLHAWKLTISGEKSIQLT